MQWIFPNAPENLDAIASLIHTHETDPFCEPVAGSGRSRNRVMAMMRSIKYIAGLIDDLVANDTAEKRIMLAGFSPGHTMAFADRHCFEILNKVGWIDYAFG